MVVGGESSPAYALVEDGADIRQASCTFKLGFKAIRDLIPDTVGQCLENEHHNPANGDALQQTTKGMLAWRKSDNFTAFTDGYRSWVNGPNGLQNRLNTDRFSWERDPVAAAPRAAATASAPRPSVSPTPAPVPTRPSTSPPPSRTQQPRLTTFLTSVVKDIDQFWGVVFRQAGWTYSSPTVTLVARGEQRSSACGPIRGPSYCLSDRTINLYEPFFEEFWPTHDFAIVTVIAHEWGHYVQHRRGVFALGLPKVNTELQADCFAGLYARYADKSGKLDEDDLAEAFYISLLSGDISHGSGKQRADWLGLGYVKYDYSVCQTW